MSQPLITVLEAVEKKIEELISIQNRQREKIKALESENRNLKRELDDKDKLLKKVQLDSEFLAVSYKLAESPDALISTRRRIARLIRTIDTCIRMMKEN